MKALVKSAIAKSKADFIEIRLEDGNLVEVAYSGKDLKKAQETRDYGGYVRALVDGSWGFISFNRSENLQDYVQKAEENARAAGRGNVALAPVNPVTDVVSSAVDAANDPRRVPLEEKVRLFGHFSSTVLNLNKKIISASVGYRQSDRKIVYANSEGTLLEMNGVWGAGGISAIGRDGNIVQSVHTGFGTRTSWQDIVDAEQQIESLGRQVLDLLSAEPARGGRYTVILDPKLAGVFIHEAFGHLSEADNVSDNPKLLSQMVLGTRFAQDHFNVLDGGALENERGSYAYDDEGVPSTLTHLIKDGLLTGRLHSRETAAAMGEPVTGNARTIGYRFSPICRMSNTFIGAGPHSFEKMLEGVDNGLYVSGGGSGNTSKGLFTFSAEKARSIKKGKLGEWIRDIVLTGNVFQTLKDIDMVGDDLVRSKSGGCGKSVGARMQYPLCVSMGSPHIRIQNVLIGGR
ncbi:TldD/PmbA family protein [bacterium]|nr:TldD/PmbA family protein [candidate division CSSED10-310 bacterium]